MSPVRSSSLPSLPPKELLILELLADHGELYGLELVTQSKRALKRGTAYVTLGRMEDKGYIQSRTVDPPPGAGGMPRRLYDLTALGNHAVKSAREWTRAARRLTPAVAR